MENPIKFIIFILLFGAGLCILIEKKQIIDQRTELENCPYRTRFVALTNDNSEVKVSSCIFYNPKLVTLDEVEYGSAIARKYAQIVIIKYSLKNIGLHIGDIEDEVNDSLHFNYNENISWGAIFYLNKKDFDGYENNESKRFNQSIKRFRARR